jgi:dipeptidyl aminopeptidase/acylaminoacyl peptidase
VPIEQSTLYANALAANKIPFEIHIFEDGPHGLSTATQSSAEDRKQLDQDARKWLPLCDAWLYKRFAFEYDN